MKNVLGIISIGFISALVSCKSGNNSTVTDSTQTKTVKTDSVVSEVAATGVAKWANLEVHVPQGWTSQEKAMNGRNLFFLLGPVESKYQTNMNILKDPMKGESLDDYIKISLAKMQSMKVQMGPGGDMPVSGVQGRYLEYVYNAPERTIVVKSYVFAKNDTAYVISATTIPELGKKYEPIFDQAVNSLKIK